MGDGGESSACSFIEWELGRGKVTKDDLSDNRHDRICVCGNSVSKSKSNFELIDGMAYVTVQGAQGLLDGLGQRRPIQQAVETYLQSFVEMTA